MERMLRYVYEGRDDTGGSCGAHFKEPAQPQ